MKTRKVIGAAMLALSLQIMFAVNVSAYLDPTAMTYIMQILIGAVVGGGAIVTVYWKKIKMFFKKKKQAKLKKNAQHNSNIQQEVFLNTETNGNTTQSNI